MSRVAWHDYFMNIAKQVATRATCPRKSVGAVVVSSERSILATGYNGALSGAEHCADVGCMMEDNHCVRVVHAEANAIVQAARNGVKLAGASIYVTASPCWGCFRLIVNAGIKKVYYGEFYRDQRTLDTAAYLGIEMHDVNNLPKSMPYPESQNPTVIKGREK